MGRYDVVIVGSGPAGCVLANRLSADGRRSVLLLEAGPDIAPGEEPPEILDTFSPSATATPRFLWRDLTVEWTASRSSRYEQGRVIGGSSSINGMWAIRGLPGDYDGWDSGGAPGWSWEKVLPHFLRIERDLDFEGPLHGRDGPIPVRRHRPDQWPPLAQAACRALRARGFADVADMNAQFGDGFCAVPMNNTPRQRVSPAMAYLDRSVRARPNLTIACGRFVESLVIEGTKVAGLRVSVEGAVEIITAGEIFVCAGAFQSPALLMRSGIGPAGELRRLGIEVVADLPGVGQNLHDHPYIYLATHLRREAMQSAGLRPFPSGILRYSSGVAGCCESDMVLTVLNKMMWHPLGQRIGAIGASIYKSCSRGTVTLRSSRATDPPRIAYDLLSDERDMTRLMAGMRLALSVLQDKEVAPLRNDIFLAAYSDAVRRINVPTRLNYAKSLTFATLLDGPSSLRSALIRTFITGGRDAGAILADDDALRSFLRETATAMWHPAGTCRMGTDDRAVVDPSCRVRGLHGLTIADASVMPDIPRGNTCLPTLMIGEKIAAERLAVK